MADTVIASGSARYDETLRHAAGDRHAAGIGFEGVSVAYNGTTVLDSLTLSVKPGEIVALIGPSGSGKTTALRAVAGFVKPSAGRVVVGERDVTGLPPYARNIGMVVQNYALFPHMKVAENVAFGLHTRGEKKAAIAARVKECLRIVGMEAYADRYPRALSGGQQQRVAIARALAIRPHVLLLDEPLSALDAQIRRSMLDEIAKLHRDLPSLTILYVTHDQTEALTLANRIGIMRDGKLAAFGSAQSLYRDPPSRFAAEFLGRANILPLSGLKALDNGDAEIRFEGETLRARNPHQLGPDDAACLCVRPHDVHLERRHIDDHVLQGTVTTVQWLGEQHSIGIAVGFGIDPPSFQLSCKPMATPPALGERVALHFSADDAMLVPEHPRHG